MSIKLFSSSEGFALNFTNGCNSNFNPSKITNTEPKTAETEESQKIENLFNTLKDLRDKRYQKALRALVKACENEGAAHLKKAETLDLGGFGLTEISEDFSLMGKVSYLHLGHNNLSSLPDSLISMADSIRKIDLAGNQFRTFPKVVYNIAIYRIENKKYLEIYLRGNPMDLIPKQIKSVICTFPHCGSIFSSYEGDFPHIFPS